jgi:fermentation-respiration switch protein FrsA (DUF1100 family)
MRTPRLLNVLGLVAAAIVTWMVVATLLLWRNQERIVFQPPAVGSPDPSGAKRVAVRAPDGTQGFVFVVSPTKPSPNPTVVLVFHGNADLAVWQVPWAVELVQRTGATVVIAEYRGYAGVPGKPTYLGAAEDARGALTYVRTLSPGRVVLFGHSLGTAIATELAAEMKDKPPAALVLQSPFTSAKDMAARMLVPVMFGIYKGIARVHYDTHRVVQTLDVPVWVAHGENDLTIPSRMGRDVSAAARNKGRLLLVEGGAHNDVAEVGGERYWQWLAEAVTGVARSAPVR